MTSPFRQQLLFQLHYNRAALFAALLGLSAAALEESLWGDDWSARRLLPHIARWEALETDRLRAALDGHLNAPVLTDFIDTDAQNAIWHAQHATTPLETGIAMLLKERNGLLNVLEQMPDDLLRVTIKLAPQVEIPLLEALNNCIEHDEEHAADIWRWRSATSHMADGDGSADLLIAALRAERKAVQAALALEGGPDAAALLHALSGSDSGDNAVDSLWATLKAQQQVALTAASEPAQYAGLVAALRGRLPLLDTHYGDWLAARRLRQ